MFSQNFGRIAATYLAFVTLAGSIGAIAIFGYEKITDLEAAVAKIGTLESSIEIVDRSIKTTAEEVVSLKQQIELYRKQPVGSVETAPSIAKSTDEDATEIDGFGYWKLFTAVKEGKRGCWIQTPLRANGPELESGTVHLSYGYWGNDQPFYQIKFSRIIAANSRLRLTVQGSDFDFVRNQRNNRSANIEGETVADRERLSGLLTQNETGVLVGEYVDGSSIKRDLKTLGFSNALNTLLGRPLKCRTASN